MIANALCINSKKKIAVKLFLVGYYGLASTALIVMIVDSCQNLVKM